MTDFFNNQKPTVINGLNLLAVKDYKDIHLATLQVLEKTGIYVEDEKAKELYGSHGARVDDKKSVVKLPASMVEDAIESAPAQVMLAGRTPDRDVLLDNRVSAYLNFGGGINVVDPHTGEVRPSTKADLAASARLCDALEQVNVYSRAVYPLDQTCFNNTAKPFFNGPESAWEVEKIIEMTAAAMGSAEKLKTRKPISFGYAVTSPLKLTRKLSESIMAAAQAGFTTYIASMAMAGGTGPVNMAGLLVQTNAEILSGIVFTQLVRKSTPVIYSSYSTQRWQGFAGITSCLVWFPECHRTASSTANRPPLRRP
jgi:trimethylamine--corrinoid protein Co-methyltransferase